MTSLKAIIADDEAELRKYLRVRLTALWPELEILAEAENGPAALELVETLKPDIAFLDIKMPGLSGMEVARRMTVPCRVVFITAYDHYAVEAFDNAAIDYLLKPVSDARLEKTVERLQSMLAQAEPPSTDITALMEKMIAGLPGRGAPSHLQWIKARQGESVRLIAVEDVYFFAAEDKYTVVKTEDGEHLIKKSIRALESELDPDVFWRIHRGTIVNAHRVERVDRSFAGRLFVCLKGLSNRLAVSRGYAQRFRQM